MKSPNLNAYLTAVAPVAAIAQTRIYPDKIPEHVYEETTRMPCAVYSRSSVERQMLFCGVDALAKFVIQVDSFAPRYDDAEALADAIDKALVGFSGVMGDMIVNAVQPDTESQPGPDPEPGLFRVYQSFNIWCREATS